MGAKVKCDASPDSWVPRYPEAFKQLLSWQGVCEVCRKVVVLERTLPDDGWEFVFKQPEHYRPVDAPVYTPKPVPEIKFKKRESREVVETVADPAAPKSLDQQLHDRARAGNVKEVLQAIDGSTGPKGD